MPRMSPARRIELGNEMLDRWTAADAQDARPALFVRDMLVRLGKGKSLSKGQREWYDSAVLSNPPKPQNEELVSRLRDDAALVGMEKVSQTLSDFAFKLSRGWKLSEKQNNFMNKLMTKADNIRKNGVWSPSSEEKISIEIGVAFGKRYTPYYLSGCPGLNKALEECQLWLKGEIKTLDEWSANKVMNLCKGDRKALVDATDRWPEGSLVTTKQGLLGLVLGTPGVAKSGKPCLTLLVEGNPTEVLLGEIKKERKRKKVS